jgi:hypothetical protein
MATLTNESPVKFEPRKFTPEELDDIRNGGDIIWDHVQHYEQLAADPEYSEACRDRMIRASIHANREEHRQDRLRDQAKRTIYLQPIVIVLTGGGGSLANGYSNDNGNGHSHRNGRGRGAQSVSLGVQCAVSGGMLRLAIPMPLPPQGPASFTGR